MHRIFVAIVLLCMLCVSEATAADNGSRYSLSLYSAGSNNGEALFSAGGADNSAPGGYAIVRDRRQFDLKSGRNSVIVHDVSRYLDPAALTVRPADETAGAQILSQRFDDETVSLEALVQKHLGRQVEVQIAGGSGTQALVSGVLLSNAGGLSLQLADGRVSTITDFNRVIFPDLPRGLAATASLRWDITAKKAGLQDFEIVYPTQGLAWRAEYGGWLANGDCHLELSGWAQVANRTGTDYPDAHLKLIAGEPHRAANAFPAGATMARTIPAAAAPLAEDSGLAGDYHEYTLDGAIDVTSGSLLRVALFPAQSIACQRQYLFEGSHVRANAGMAPIAERNYGNEAPSPIRSTLTFKSDRALPAGRLRILQNASDGAAEFTGEDSIGHTPRGEATTIQLGNAFDLRGVRRQSEFAVDKDHRTLGESFAIRLTNAGAGVQIVVVREHLYRWTQWAITQASAKYVKRDTDTIDFSVDVPANGSANVTYSVQYQWSESLK